MTTSEDTPGRPSKVARLIEEYDLDGFGAKLERQWTAEESGERASLRDLATLFNQRLLREVLDEARIDTLDGEVENLYRLLTDDDVSVSDRTRAERRLKRNGVDVETLRSDFLSYQAIRTYLQKHRDAEYSRESDDQVTSVDDQVQQFRTRLVNVTESKLEALEDGDNLDIGEFRVTVDVRVFCEDCGRQFAVGTLLDRGDCDCSRT